MNLVNLTAIMNIGLLIILKIKNVLMERKSSTFRSIFHITLLVKRVRILDAAHNVIIISYVQTYVGVTGGQYKFNVICTISNVYRQVVRFIIQYCVPVNILLCVLYP